MQGVGANRCGRHVAHEWEALQMRKTFALKCKNVKFSSSGQASLHESLFCNASLNFLSHELATLVASLNLGEFVVSGHSEDEASNEVWDSHS